MAIDVGDVPVRRPAGLRRADLPPGGRDQGPRPRGRAGRRPAAADLHRRQAAAAGAPEPALQRLQVHRGRARSTCGSSWPTAGWSADHPVLSRADARRGVLGQRHRHRHPADKLKIIFEPFQQADTGTEPQVRRHGPGAVDQPGDRPPARRRDPGRRARPARGAPSRSTCRWPTQPAAPRPSRRRGASRRRPRRRLAERRAGPPGETGRRAGSPQAGRRRRPRRPSSPATGSS